MALLETAGFKLLLFFIFLSHTLKTHSAHLLICYPLTMRAMLCCFLVLFLHILGLVSVSSRHFGPVNGFAFFNQGAVQNQNVKTLQVIAQSSSIKKMEFLEDKEMNKVGSKPPSCEDKCYGCRPCDAIQVPKTTAHLGVQYTNYEPEGWMCKCGPTFYSP